MKKILIVLIVICLNISIVFADVEMVRASHILVKSEGMAINVKARIYSGDDFGQLAREYSQCPSWRNNGDLGFFKRGDMVKEFENAAFSMKVGEVSKPIQTQYGWHIIKVTDRQVFPDK